jgi:hypothetical protein
LLQISAASLTVTGVKDFGRKLAATGLAIGLFSAGLAWFIGGYLMTTPESIASTASGKATTELTLQTVAGLGDAYSQPTWVSYLIRDAGGTWRASTNYTVPANSTVRVTVLQYDGASGLRNPFLARPQGVVGNAIQVDGKTVEAIDPTLASHTFAIPEMHLVVPLEGVDDNAPDQCEAAPCGLDKAHRTITFTFKTGAPGRFRWQCFVPCAAGFIHGFGGPMQTIGYMDGFINVV